ncbi:MAG TPA: type II toxin-antitoxin system VapC family toxin [Streptosporangiaceae bacterium]
MIILDTNVISELTRPHPEPTVISWLDSLPAEETAITAITAAELRYGVHRLPDGRRKNELSEAVHAIINTDFRGRVEPFDVLAADQYANVVTARERAGRPISTSDAQIAAICRVLDAALATRNTSDFTDTGIDLIDPWKTTD